jgi:hypothetical protein
MCALSCRSLISGGESKTNVSLLGWCRASGFWVLGWCFLPVVVMVCWDFRFCGL